jgi:choline dehydrogenase-like flavoprotein
VHACGKRESEHHVAQSLATSYQQWLAVEFRTARQGVCWIFIMASSKFDVCVVGSGPGGGIATYVLAAAGLKVALVEAGPRLRPGIDYNAHANVYEHLDARLAAGLNSPISSVSGDFSDRNHFTGVGDNPGHGLLRAVGGRSLCWAGHSLRFGPLDFRRWPIAYDQVAPYYSRAERFMGVYGSRDGLSNMPDGEYTRTVALRCGEQVLKRGVNRLKRQGRAMDFVAVRKAMLTAPHFSKRALCHYCGHCMEGCEVDAKYTSANTPVPLAMRTGNLTMFTDSTMTRILMDSGRRVTGIEYTKRDGSINKIECRALVLACSAVETARQLLLNTSKDFPEGLANSSGQVGRNLTSHFGITVKAAFPELMNRDGSNDDGTDYYHGLLTGLYWDKPHKDFDGTYQVQCGSGVQPRRMAVRNIAGYGAKFKRALYEENLCHAGMNMQGSLMISPKKFVDLDTTRKDRFGAFLPRVHLHYEENELAMARDMLRVSEEIIHAAGGSVSSKPKEITPSSLVIDSNHWVGTARMGGDAKTSVVNTFGQSHDIPNLFIGDASVFAAYPEKNPTLTNIALSWRMSEHLVRKFRSGDLA